MLDFDIYIYLSRRCGFDYDLMIIGDSVGGHGAALHAIEKVSYAHAALQVLLGGV